MTKVRPPHSIDAAMARIAGQLPGSWAEMTQVCGRKNTSTIRRWADQDRPGDLPMPAAIALDVAYQRAGGVGRPLFETYALQLRVARETAFADEIAIARHLCIVIREIAQAQEATVLSTLPSATPHDRQKAIGEWKDVLREVTAAIDMIGGTDTLCDPRPPPDTS